MMESIKARVDRLARRVWPIITGDNGTITPSRVVFFTLEFGGTAAVCEDGSRLPVTVGLAELEKLLKGLFIRTHRNFLINLERIKGISRRYPAGPAAGKQKSEAGSLLLAASPFTRATLRETEARARDECELHLDGFGETVPVTATYARKVKKALGIRNFLRLTPENPEDKALTQYGIMDFGWRERGRLDTGDAEAVKVHKKKWDIKTFDRIRMLKHFRMVVVPEIDKRKLIKNIIFQLHRWIKAGMEPKTEGNIRSLWYQIKAVLAYHSNVLEPGDVDIFYDVLTEMIEGRGMFKYRDFGFMDVNEPYRGIGGTRPEAILASEKVGHYYYIKRLAAEVGTSFICLKGEPALISLEYFSEELSAVSQKPKTVFVISDLDPAGYSIMKNLVAGLENNGHEVTRAVPLVDLSIFTDEEISFIRYQVASMEKQGKIWVPVPPTSQSQMTKAVDWFEKIIQDDRLMDFKVVAGRKIWTIWGIESDAADQMAIRQRFLEGN